MDRNNHLVLSVHCQFGQLFYVKALEMEEFSEDLSISNLEELRKVILASGGHIEALTTWSENITGQFVNGLDNAKLSKLKRLYLNRCNQLTDKGLVAALFTAL